MEFNYIVIYFLILICAHSIFKELF